MWDGIENSDSDEGICYLAYHQPYLLNARAGARRHLVLISRSRVAGRRARWQLVPDLLIAADVERNFS